MKSHVLIGGLILGAIMFILGGLFYGMSGIMDGFTTPEGMAAYKTDGEMSFPLLIAGELVIGLALSMVYSKWARGTHNFGHGFQFGATVGVAMGLGLGLIWMATSKMMEPTGYIVDAIYSIVALGLASGLMSMFYAKFEK